MSGQYLISSANPRVAATIVALPDSGYVVATTEYNTSSAIPIIGDGILTKFNPDHSIKWNLKFPKFVFRCLAPAAGGSILSSGYINEPLIPIPKLLIQKTDSLGNGIWRRKIDESVTTGDYYLYKFQKILELSNGNIIIINHYTDGGTGNSGIYGSIFLLDNSGNLIKSIKFDGQLSDIIEGFNNTLIGVFKIKGGYPIGLYRNCGIIKFDFDLNVLQCKVHRSSPAIVLNQCFSDTNTHTYYFGGITQGSATTAEGNVILKTDSALTNNTVQNVFFKKRYRQFCSPIPFRFAKDKSGIIAAERGSTYVNLNYPEVSFDKISDKARSTAIKFDNGLNIIWSKRLLINKNTDLTGINLPSIQDIAVIGDIIVYNGSVFNHPFLYYTDTVGRAGNCVSTNNPIQVRSGGITLADSVINMTNYNPIMTSFPYSQLDDHVTINATCITKQKPLSKFIYYPTVICNETYVSFIDSSYYEPENWQWIFPPEADLAQADDTTCFPNIYKVRFTQAGVFPVKLVTANEMGTDTLVKYVTVINGIPAPNLGNDTTICQGDSVRLIHHPVPNSTHYFYTVGTGFYSTNDTIFVKTTGTYICVATSACGSKYDTVNVSVASRPQAGFFFFNACDSLSVSFRDTSRLNGNNFLNYKWRFTDKNNVLLGTSTSQNPVFTYPFFDTVKATLIVQSPLVCVQADTLTQTIILKAKPLAAFTYTNSCGNLSAIFTNTSTISAGSIQSSTWLLGDGNTATTFNPVHTYGSFGTYTAKLVITSTAGCTSDTAVQSIVIRAKPIARMSYDTNTCAGRPVTLRDSSFIVGGTLQSMYWAVPALNLTSNLPFFQLLFPSGGTYTVLHAITSAQGCTSDTISQNIFIESIPVAAFAAPSTGCSGDAVTFTSNSSILVGNINSLRWQIGNNPPTNQNATLPFTYSFPTAGSYTVGLQAVSSHGCTSNLSTQAIAIESKPVADFTNTLLCPGKAVQFTNTSTAATGTISSSKWSINNATATAITGTGDYSYTFIQGGTYTVQLTVTTAGGCSSTIIKNIVVIPAIAGAGNDTMVQEGEPFTLQGSGGISYLWQPPTGLDDATKEKPSGMLNSSQRYTLQVTTGQGCIGFDTVLVTVLRNLKIANTFSPNGDGINDEWRIDQLKDYPNAQLQLFDRYGQQVYTAKGNGITGWKGTAGGSNKPVPLGTYYYVITLNNELNKKPYTGWVMVVR